jgi:phage tail protein X
MAYTTQSGDTWDLIAKRVYESELYADKLMAANPEYISIFAFDSGVELTTPELSEEEQAGDTSDLPPWKQ